MLNEYKNYIEREKSLNTVKTYVRCIEAFLNWLKERYNENDETAITNIDIKEYQSYLLNIKKYAASGVLLRMNAIISYCEFLYLSNVLKLDIKKNFKFIKVQKLMAAPDTINKNELNRYRREVYKSNKLRDIAIIELLINTGIRASELVEIEIDDIRISERKGELKIRQGKGNKYRVVPLNSDARTALDTYTNERNIKFINEKKLFIGQRGPLSQDGLNKLLKRYAAKCGLEDKIHPHMFRHFFATQLIREKKADLFMVADILGHSTINTTRRYAQASIDEIAMILENLNIGA